MRLSAKEVGSRKSASRAGLRYVTDGVRGITRKRVGTGWAYYAPSGERIIARDARARINRLAIPPAWTRVWICPDPNGHIQATGSDARGRKQYRYHPEFRALRESTKYEHMMEFARALPAIRQTPFHLVAVASRSQEKAARVAARFGCKAVVGYARLLEMSDVDAVYMLWVMDAVDGAHNLLQEMGLPVRF